jgi:bifunctional UDP-N-acetylglucosamine pyrophosphorylase/glucosamine-1-phosphate N-acetyltransferase
MPRLTAVIMAAGQGTRMRSKTPKVLHDLCGWPLVRWPVEAARAAGAERVVVVGGPDGALEGHLPEGVELAVQHEARGTGRRGALGRGVHRARRHRGRAQRRRAR